MPEQFTIVLTTDANGNILVTPTMDVTNDPTYKLVENFDKDGRKLANPVYAINGGGGGGTGDITGLVRTITKTGTNVTLNETINADGTKNVQLSVDGITTAQFQTEMNNYYTKVEVDSFVTALQTNIDLKANKVDVYTKTETDNLLSPKANKTDVVIDAIAGTNIGITRTQTPNGIVLGISAATTDLTGIIKTITADSDVTTEIVSTNTDGTVNVKITLPNYYTKTEVDTLISTKANSTDTVFELVDGVNTTVEQLTNAANGGKRFKINANIPPSQELFLFASPSDDINAKIDQALAEDKIVYLNAGTYYLTTPIIIKTGTRIWGSQQSIIRTNTSNFDLFTTNNVYATDFWLRGFKVLLNQASAPTTHDTIFQLTRGFKSRVEDINIVLQGSTVRTVFEYKMISQNDGFGCFYNFLNNIRITKTASGGIVNGTETGITLLESANSNTIQGVSTSGIYRPLLLGNGVNQNTIIGCQFEVFGIGETIDGAFKNSFISNRYENGANTILTAVHQIGNSSNVTGQGLGRDNTFIGNTYIGVDTATKYMVNLATGEAGLINYQTKVDNGAIEGNYFRFTNAGANGNLPFRNLYSITGLRALGFQNNTTAPTTTGANAYVLNNNFVYTDGTTPKNVVTSITSTDGTVVPVSTNNNVDLSITNALSLKQNTLTAGSGITIDANNVISATGGTAGSTFKTFVELGVTNAELNALTPQPTISSYTAMRSSLLAFMNYINGKTNSKFIFDTINKTTNLTLYKWFEQVVGVQAFSGSTSIGDIVIERLDKNVKITLIGTGDIAQRMIEINLVYDGSSIRFISNNFSFEDYIHPLYNNLLDTALTQLRNMVNFYGINSGKKRLYDNSTNLITAFNNYMFVNAAVTPCNELVIDLSFEYNLNRDLVVLTGYGSFYHSSKSAITRQLFEYLAGTWTNQTVPRQFRKKISKTLAQDLTIVNNTTVDLSTNMINDTTNNKGDLVFYCKSATGTVSDTSWQDNAPATGLVFDNLKTYHTILFETRLTFTQGSFQVLNMVIRRGDNTAVTSVPMFRNQDGILQCSALISSEVFAGGTDPYNTLGFKLSISNASGVDVVIPQNSEIVFKMTGVAGI